MLFGPDPSRYVPMPTYWTYTTTTTTPLVQPQTEDELRRIVREELADLIPVDVPDAPPEDLT